MSTGSNNTTGERISNVFNGAGFLARDNFTEGDIAVAWAGSGADNKDVCLPSNAFAQNGGRDFMGVWMAAGTAVSATDRGGLQKLGIAQCRLKANTACQKGTEAGYLPSDAGTVIPVTPANAALIVVIGRFSQTKASSSAVQFVGVELGAQGSGRGEQLVGAIVASSTAVTNTTAETLFDQTVTIPANRINAAGIVLRIRAKARQTSGNAADTLTLKLYMGGLSGALLAATAAIDVTDLGGDLGVIDATVTVRTAGASGVITSAAVAGLGAPGTATMRVSGTVGTLARDFTAAQIIGVSATWSAASTSNSAVLEDLAVTTLG